jgi:hypothetical protein
MKKILFSALAIATLAVIPAMAWEVAITAQELPAEAQAFLKKNFAQSEVVVATHDKDVTDNDYTVMLNDGTKVEFDSSGKWESVKNHNGKIPAGVIPAEIQNYIKAHYPSLGVEKIERKRYGYEVELTNDLDMKFTLNGRFVGLDD